MRIPYVARPIILLVFVALTGCSGPTTSLAPTTPGRTYPGPTIPVKEQKTVSGEFVSPGGAEGQEGFGCEFDTPPNVVVSAPFGTTPVMYTYISEVTKTGFKWKNNGSKEKNQTDLRVAWTATGYITITK